MADSAGVSRAIDDIFWIVLGRTPSDVERRDEARLSGRDAERLLTTRLLSSPEFIKVRTACREGRDLRDPGALDSGLDQVTGDHQTFVRLAYKYLLGRPADEAGLRHYASAVAAGDRRANVLRNLILSEEFEGRFDQLA